MRQIMVMSWIYVSVNEPVIESDNSTPPVDLHRPDLRPLIILFESLLSLPGMMDSIKSWSLVLLQAIG
ncbi:hypothetical protein T07_6945 [Trichinella nelsoni]|uniref:Uncharacterized protein n=1 Tax=Trichinella nelsoni TaxID=6336 RepID=A0A0V0SG93_9BILA|nr:hypothetical protein T07_6945 [Trichinella nelsoni]